MIRKSIVKVGAGAIGLALLLTGCSGQTSAGGGSANLDKVSEYKGTITMVNKFADPEIKAYFPAMAKAYEKLHPDVTVKIQQESDQGYKDKLKVLTASKDLPDIYFAWAGNYAKQYIDAGMALDLTSVIGPDTKWGKTIAPSAVDAFSYDKKDYGIPIDLDAKFMLYNKKIMADAGVEVPTTFDGLLKSCTALKAKGIAPITFGNQYGWPALHYITQLNSYDVPAATLKADYTPKTGKFTNQGYVKALSQFKELLDTCVNEPKTTNALNHDDARVSFMSGKSAMMYNEWVEFGYSKDTQLEKDGWGFFRLPAPDGAKGSTNTITGAPDGFLINPKSKNPALAVDFMKFVVSKKNAEVQQKLMAGYPSAVIGSLTADNTSQQSVDALADVNKADGFAIWLDTVTASAVASAYLSGVEGLVSGSQTPEAVMKSVQSAASSAR